MKSQCRWTDRSGTCRLEGKEAPTANAPLHRMTRLAPGHNRMQERRQREGDELAAGAGRTFQLSSVDCRVRRPLAQPGICATIHAEALLGRRANDQWIRACARGPRRTPTLTTSGVRLVVGQRTLDPYAEVRILDPQPEAPAHAPTRRVRLRFQPRTANGLCDLPLRFPPYAGTNWRS